MRCLWNCEAIVFWGGFREFWNEMGGLKFVGNYLSLGAEQGFLSIGVIICGGDGTEPQLREEIMRSVMRGDSPPEVPSPPDVPAPPEVPSPHDVPSPPEVPSPHDVPYPPDLPSPS